MVNENCERLFEYLRSILFDQKIDTLDIEVLDESHQKLGRGLQFLQKSVEEMLHYSAELSQGNLSEVYASRDNFLCVNLKNMQANLNHLTWQAKQVAAGDYSQHISYLGEFSDAFNTMIQQLKERERLLKEETTKVKERAEVIQGYNTLLLELIGKQDEWILVIDADSENHEILYCNKNEQENDADVFCESCEQKLSFCSELLNWHGQEKYKVWKREEDSGKIYRITTFSVEWQGRNAFTHIVADITVEEKGKRKLENKAYIDPGTGIRNRLFFEEYMEKLLQKQQHAVFCYLDLDGLKYVNDKYGHTEGDLYIRRFVEIVQKQFRNTDLIARIGGDEFCIVLLECPLYRAYEKLKHALDAYIHDNDKEYPSSFSYGVVEIDGKETSLEKIIKKADAAMYEFKRKNKEKYIRE